MAGVSAKELKSRIRSMENTRQITKAMEMVAASKLRGAQERALESRPYFETLYATMSDLAQRRQDDPSPFTLAREGNKTCCIVIAGDRGLAGGYNSGVLKMAYSALEGQDATVLPLGRKAVDFFRARGVPMLTQAHAEAAGISVGDCFSMARLLCEKFLAGEFDRIVLAYTNFVSLLNQSPAVLELLPLKAEKAAEKPSHTVLYEPDSASVLRAIVPEYLGGLIYGALCESIASEQAARRTAMDAATKNADEMIDDLSLKFNRARQGAITQEITEIVAGSEA